MIIALYSTLDTLGVIISKWAIEFYLWLDPFPKPREDS